mmetsp:Transcript_15909/g.27263  ORF Transcript_15909/g.27263 Transcript_15909/m.27263 type:complete len:141 (-) Transcript_15909:17-439(-)
MYRNPTNPAITFVVAMVVFFLSMAGLVYNLIRTPPWTGFNRQTGAPEYIMASSRSQYVAEGLIVATLMSGAGIAHVGINVIGSKRLSPMVYRLIFYTLLIVYFFCANSLYEIFMKKYGFYPYRYYVEAPSFLRPYLPWTQ